MTGRAVRTILPALGVLCLLSGTSSAQYVQRAAVTSNGALTFTGNTLGLDGAKDDNGQGTRGAIGTFITTDTTLQDLTPAPRSAPAFPVGTTNDWRLNRSAARLRLPPGTRVLHAELIWGGTVAGSDPADNVEPFIDDPILFTTPAGTSAVAPDPSTSHQSGSVSGRGTCNACFYVRTADVTALVAAAGAGTYAVGRVPATQGTNDNQNGSAGWTLAVLYEDFSQPVRNLLLYLGLEKSGPADALSGFCTPAAGTVSARLAVAAMEGDARTTGDGLLLGPTSTLGNADRLSGPRNPPDSFFGGQITDDQGNLDLAGTFGTRNHAPGAPVAGARQSWDIANVNASGRLTAGATSAFVKGVSSGDTYQMMALGLQIDEPGPRFSTAAGTMTVDRATAAVGDVLTYTVVLDNTAGSTDAMNLVFFDTPAAGNGFLPGTFAVNGVVQPAADPTVGAAIGTIPAGGSVTVRFQVRVNTAPPAGAPVVRTNVANWTFQYATCGQALQNGSGQSSAAVTTVPVADLAVATTLGAVTAGAAVTYQIVVTNAGPSAASGAVLIDSGTTPALANVTWACSAPTGGSCSAASGTGPPASTLSLPPGLSATFRVTGTLPSATPAGTITDTAGVTASATVPDPVSTNNTATATAAITTRADIAVTQTGSASTSPGNDVVYTITVTNRGPSDASSVLVTDPVPAGLTLVSLTGACAAAPGCALLSGASATVTATFNVPPAYAGADPIVNQASVTSGTADTNSANNSARATTSLGTPVADVSIAVSDNAAQVTAGTTTIYTITATNAGPASAAGTQIRDTFDPAMFASVQWQCAASGTSTCTATGIQAGDINTLVTIDPGPANAVVFTVQAQVRPDVTGTIEDTATATVAADVTDPSPDANSATDADAIRVSADLSVTVTGPPALVPGTAVDYVVTVRNAGPSTALGVSFEDEPEESVALPLAATGLIQSVQAPADATCVSVPFTAATGQSGFVPDCTIPVLGPNATRTFTIRLNIPPDLLAATPFGTSVTLIDSAAVSGDVDDPTPGDHVAATSAPITPRADVSVSVIGPASVVAGSVASYFIDVTNAGPSVAQNVVVDDPTPGGLAVAGADGPCAGRGFPCVLPILQPGDVISIRFDLLVPIDYNGPPVFMDAVTIQPGVQDPTTADNSSSVSTLVVPAQADLSIAITGPSSIAPGSTFEYVGTVTNLGPGAALNVRTSTVVPAGVTFVGGSAPASPTTCTLPTAGVSNLLFCVTPTLPVGGVLDFHVQVQADANLVPGALITLIGTATSPTPDLHAANDRVVVPTRVATPDQADLIVEMTDFPDPAIAGTNVTYTINVSSLGPATATNVTVTDTLPIGFALVSATPTQGACAAAVCALGTIAPLGGATITLVATPSTTGSFVNVATAAADQPDPVPANNTASQDTTAATADQADVVIRIQGPTLMEPGQSSFYAIEIDNLGPGPAQNVEIANFLPPGFTFYANAGDCVTAFPCEFENLDAGQSRTILTTFTIDPLFAAPASAVITATLTMDTVDPTPNTHTVSLTTTVDPIGTADLVVTLADSPDPIYTGSSLSYFMTAANRGPASAPGATLTYVLPPGVGLISARATVGTCSGTTVVTCQLGDMPAGSLVRVGILATAPAVVPATNPMVSIATLTSGSPDPDPSTNQITELTTVVARPATSAADLSVAISGPATVRPGQNVTYTIGVRNAGPDTAAPVTLDDPAPADLTLVSVSGDCLSTHPCALGPLAPGESRTAVATYRVPPSYSGPNPIVNTAAVSSPTFDPVAANNVAIARTSVGVHATGCGFAGAVPPGGTTNSGGRPLTATPARVADFLADNPSFGAGAPAACGDVDGDGIPELVTGVGFGAEPIVRIWSLRGSGVTKLAEFAAYDRSFGGGVSVAVGDVDGDGVAEVITGAGLTGGPHVRVWKVNGSSVTEVAGFFAYDAAFAGGVSVAAGDVNGDGLAEIITGAGPGGAPDVRVWSLAGGNLKELAGILAYDPAFRGGVSVAAGDVNGDGIAEIVTGAGPGGGPHVRVWSVSGSTFTEMAGFFAYDPSFPGGVSVAVGDVNGDGAAEVITGSGQGGPPEVRVWSIAAGAISKIASFLAFDGSFPFGVTVAAGDLTGDGAAEIITSARFVPEVRIWNFDDSTVAEVTGFFAYLPAFAGGASVAIGDITGDGVADLITGAGPGGGPHVRAWRLNTGSVTEHAGLFAFDPAFSNGVLVAAGDLTGDGVAEFATAAGPGAEPRVRVWGLKGGQLTLLTDFLAYTPAFAGGVAVAIGDLTGARIGELVTGAGPGGGPHVRIWRVSAGGVSEVAGFYAFDPSFAGGVSVATGDLNGDGVAELITAAGFGGGSRVRVWSLLGGTLRLLDDFFAFDPSFTGVVSVAAGDVNGDGVAEIITAAGRGTGPDVRVWRFDNGGVTPIAEFFAYDPRFAGGVWVAAGDLDGDGIAEIVTGAGPGGGPHVRIWRLHPPDP